MRLIDCDARHAPAILAILNDAIVHTTALYDYLPRPPEAMDAWFETKRRGNFPVIGLENEAGGLMGFASFGTFRAFPAYKYTVEHSLYVASDFRGHGVGKHLLRAIIDRARSQGVHTMIGVIDSSNAASIALHTQHGFKHAGTLNQAGFKFGRWLDVCFYQLLLDTPADPRDG